MKPARFDYQRAETLDEVHTALAENGDDTRVIAGGQTLLPMLSMRLARPKLLVDIMHVPELRRIKADKNAIRIGAGVRQAELLAWRGLAQRQPLLAAALPWVGHAQTRSRGTICGSAAHADPSAEIPLVMLALGSGIELSSRRKRRSVPANDFFTGMMSTARAPDELIEAVTVPVARAGSGYAFQEFGRRHGDFAIVACAAVVSSDSIVFAVGGVADRPERRDFPLLEGGALDEALDAFAWELDAREDLHATAPYRRELVRRMGRASIEEARRCRV
ncbi:MAG: FAD binding domain-containing protein [Pseudolabrys sp.]|nr:FAD binding domain-containing protein [Pseudolabrys sp.]MDP2295094.1 FAD binding domain-containing protein [Pseudolabrys sp.]